MQNLTPVQQRILTLRSALRTIADQLCDVRYGAMYPTVGSEADCLSDKINPGRAYHVSSAVEHGLQSMVDQFDSLDLMVGSLALDAGLPAVFGPYANVRHAQRYEAALKAAADSQPFAGADAAEFGPKQPVAAEAVTA